MNHALRRAMANAKMTEAQLAEACGVDTKTVSRWITAPNRIPHARHRWAASEALGEEEAALWPNAVRSALSTGPDREIVQVFPYRSAAPTSLWKSLVTKAQRELMFAGYTNYFLWLEQANLAGALRRKAEGGCRVRFLIGDPDSPVTAAREAEEGVPLTLSTRIAVTLNELEKLHEVSGIEGRFETGHVNLSVFRFDDEMIVTPILARRVGHDSPMMHLRRRQTDGMFDRFTAHVEELWSRGRDIREARQDAQA
ncbi:MULTISPECIES: XRE family transcriptional regulator [unclassified Streptomyces]|uniref:XRE family transcriptional regulator n=1 Tax=unclassified Streptomyces TaxID=2593676 RepID=UPI002E0DD642|nr:helix-turn-helix domain-containing protein [Streptomyces sp. NBC_01207]WTA20178.1 helix-turn-helix domain-containing protein [Streptomyces sp. NBC_00853]